MESKKIDKKGFEDSGVDNEFDALVKTIEVKSDIPLNSDHVIAHLPQTEKEFTIESLENASLAVELLKRYATKQCIPQWDTKKRDYQKNKDGTVKYFSLEEVDKIGFKKCMKNAKEIFNSFMQKINAIALVNRNREDNFMLSKGWYKNKEDENKQIGYTQDDRTVLQKIKDKFTGDSEEEYTD